MKKRVIKIAGSLLIGCLLSSFLIACDSSKSGRNPFLDNHKHYNWGEDYYDIDDDDYGYWEDDDDYSYNNQGGKTSSNNNNKTSVPEDEILSYVYTVGSGECGVYVVASSLDGVTSINVPATFTDRQGNVYIVKYDSNNGFNGLGTVKTVTFSDGFESVKIGFGASYGLEKLVFPASLKKIDCRMLVGCSAFKNIEFKGTKAQWEAIDKLESWNDMAPEFTVKCSDGNIVVPVYEEE